MIDLYTHYGVVTLCAEWILSAHELTVSGSTNNLIVVLLKCKADRSSGLNFDHLIDP